MVDGADVKIDGFHGTERALDFSERSVTAHCVGRGHLVLRYAGADDVEPIERRFGADLFLEPMELEAGLLDREREVFTDLVLVDNLADPDPDFVATGERSVLDEGTDFLQFLLGRLEQRLALVPAQLA